ncbi:MAG: NADH:flavin oxidoreductase [Candidatus Heimdallarchaeota archaeon]|nr:NADH:flavin oxidoreductase [Candidatus Heimdallarchaeota archaeon]
MSKLFSTFVLKNLVIKNRLMRSATTSYWSDEEGILRDCIIDYYEKLAKGSLGIIIKGHSYVLESGKAHTGQSGLSDEKHLPKMVKLTKTVHSYDVPIIAQINHGGYTSKADRMSASEYVTQNWKAREATLDDIELVIESFAKSAELAIHCGFDGIQIHSAHGYLNSQFLSDNVNKRIDKFGGTLENRTRLLIEIFKAIKKKIGNEPIIAVKLNCDDFALEGGFKIEDSIKVSNWLFEKGIDFIEISGGGPMQDSAIRKIRGKSKKESGYFEANFAGHVEKIRNSNPKVPLAIVDGIRSRSTMDNILEVNIADFISMSKPFIIEPNLAYLLKDGQKESSCIDCRECLSPERFGKRMLSCAQIDP